MFNKKGNAVSTSVIQTLCSVTHNLNKSFVCLQQNSLSNNTWFCLLHTLTIMNLCSLLLLEDITFPSLTE